MKPLQRLIIVFSILIVLFGFSQLNNEKDILSNQKPTAVMKGSVHILMYCVQGLLV